MKALTKALLCTIFVIGALTNTANAEETVSMNKLHEIDTPQWMLDLFKAIDALDFSEGSGFSLFTDDIEMVFGPNHIQGIENVKAFFTKLDAPFVTVHNVNAVWKTGNTYVMQGSADLTSRTDPNAAPIHAEPLFNIIYMNDDGKVESYVVSAPPELMKQTAQ